jgi:hypothetical protein
MNFKKYSLTTLSVLTLILSSQAAKAEENLWLYAKGTDTRPKGSFEAKISDIMMKGKSSGDYVRHEIRPEVEYGVTNSLTVGAGLIIFNHNYSVDNPDLMPMYETQGEEGGRFNQTSLGGFEVVTKYNILSPYKDSMGLSVGIGYENREKYRLDGSDINQKSYVGKVFMQKNWIDNRLVFVVNLKTELERRKGEGQVLEEEIALEINSGISYRFMPRHFAGIEFRRQADYLNPSTIGDKADPDYQSSNWDLNDMSLGTNHQYAMYAGPTYHYAKKNWWITTGVLWQFAGSGSKNAFSNDGKNWDEHEKIHAGLSYGYEF